MRGESDAQPAAAQVRKCQANGRWSGKAPTQCGPPMFAGSKLITEKQWKLIDGWMASSARAFPVSPSAPVCVSQAGFSSYIMTVSSLCLGRVPQGQVGALLLLLPPPDLARQGVPQPLRQVPGIGGGRHQQPQVRIVTYPSSSAVLPPNPVPWLTGEGGGWAQEDVRRLPHALVECCQKSL